MLSIILPIKDEKENIEPLLHELKEVLQHHSSSEVIAVDDGSTDGTREVLQKAQSSFPFLRLVSLARNYGQTAAIAAGMDAAKGDIFLPLDADGQNDPHDIPLFLAKLEEDTTLFRAGAVPVTMRGCGPGFPAVQILLSAELPDRKFTTTVVR